jgi:hypothetical protein
LKADVPLFPIWLRGSAVILAARGRFWLVSRC